MLFRVQCVDCLTRVPLIVSWPGHVPCGATDESMANLIDIVPTVLKLQGLDIPASMHCEPLPTVTDSDPRDATFVLTLSVSDIHTIRLP